MIQSDVTRGTFFGAFFKKCSKQFSGILQDLKIRSVKNSLHSVFKFCEQKEMPHLGDVKHERYNIIDQFGEI
ncbi:unnamed protein product [Rhizophagus irregularis]|nr:unnamed protein product [Rhizophagus irregularis]